MEFSLSLALLNWIGLWAEKRRHQVIKAITEKKISRLTTGILIDIDSDGMCAISGMTMYQLTELSGLLKISDEIGHASPLTRVLRQRIETKVDSRAEVRP